MDAPADVEPFVRRAEPGCWGPPEPRPFDALGPDVADGNGS